MRSSLRVIQDEILQRLCSCVFQDYQTRKLVLKWLVSKDFLKNFAFPFGVWFLPSFLKESSLLVRIVGQVWPIRGGQGDNGPMRGRDMCQGRGEWRDARTKLDTEEKASIPPPKLGSAGAASADNKWKRMYRAMCMSCAAVLWHSVRCRTVTHRIWLYWQSVFVIACVSCVRWVWSWEWVNTLYLYLKSMCSLRKSETFVFVYLWH